MNYTMNAMRHTANGIVPAIMTSIELSEMGFHISVKKDGVIFSGRKLLEGFCQKNEIQQMKKGSSLILSITDILTIISLILFTVVSSIFDVTEPFPVPLISILLLLIALLMCRFAVIVVKLKDGKTYCIPYSGSIFFKQLEERERMEIVKLMMRN